MTSRFAPASAAYVSGPRVAPDGARNAAGCMEFKLGFSGCTVTHGLRGLLFAAGLASQCAFVVRRVRELLRVRR